MLIEPDDKVSLRVLSWRARAVYVITAALLVLLIQDIGKRSFFVSLIWAYLVITFLVMSVQYTQKVEAAMKLAADSPERLARRRLTAAVVLGLFVFGFGLYVALRTEEWILYVVIVCVAPIPLLLELERRKKRT